MAESNHLEEIKKLAQPWIDYLRPAMEDDNNYYRGQCQLDGKDAAGIGEDFEAVIAHAAALDKELTEARRKVELYEWMAHHRKQRPGITDEEILRLTYVPEWREEH